MTLRVRAPATGTAVGSVAYLTCMVCGATYRPDEVGLLCPRHGDDGVLDVVYDYDRIAGHWRREDLDRTHDPTMWRYAPLLPVAPDSPVPPQHVGGTPLYESPRLADAVGVADLWVKDETVEPTGSLKDRASALALVKAHEARADTVVTASTGNAAAALAGLAAATGQRAVILVPAAAPPAKIAQLLAYDATVLLVDGSYDDAVALCREAAAAFGWYDRTTGRNPYMSEGKKTAAFEIAEQLDWQVPDVVATGVGDGCIVGALYKGFADLVALGWLPRVPRLLGVQAAGSAFLADAWRNREDVLAKPAIHAATVADSIAAGLPLDRLKAMRAVRESSGAFVTVSDEEILAAIPRLARTTGVFAEPAGAAPLAGLTRAVADGLVGPQDRVVLVATGSGLKDVPAAMDAVRAAGVVGHPVTDLDDVAEVVGR